MSTPQEALPRAEQAVDPSSTAAPQDPAAIREAIRNPETPELVKRYLKQQLFGEGGNGRKARQQDLLKSRTVVEGQRRSEGGFRKPPSMSSRQFKKAKKLLRQAAKISGRQR